ncbi:MAG: RNA-directed DNA polymerase [Rivularia sp. (in: Bacteria)]|nr:RNA-directed DNA polymerase [Rivularia sp. MS3]
MSEQPRTRQELYEQVRKVGREEFILEEMIRYGFWSSQGTIPEDPADEIRRASEIRRELQELRRESSRLHNEQKLRKEALKKRLAESRKKQQENKERREKERLERATAWQQKKQREIIYLGEEVSAGLNHNEANLGRLRNNNLPLCNTAAEIAAAMGITVNKLRFLAFNRKTSTVSHYIRFKMPKKTGGERFISAPMPNLKQAQYWILTNILDKLKIHEAAHGFCQKRSIITNATPHVAADVVINFDLKDFFPSISYKRVKGLFYSFGYSETAATIFALICTSADVEKLQLDGTIYYVAVGDRYLPQGSPASPAISNLLCRRLDKRLTGMADKLGFTYTRYADDLTFSASGESLRHICNILRRTESIVTHEGLRINQEKTRVLRNTGKQEVTGIVVNEKLSVCRKTLRKFRATLYQIEKEGLENKKWGNSTNLLAAITGYANFVAMVNPEKGIYFQQQVKRIKSKYGKRE